jgi:hypothetical protein
MKKILLLLIISFSAHYISAQDIYKPMNNMTDAEKATINDAQKKIVRADRMMSNALNDYEKYKPLFTSKRKHKRKKAEKKTVTAKRNMLSAAGYYDKGYNLLYQLYLDKLSSLVFYFQDDQNKADQLAKDADKLFKSGHSLLSRNIIYTDKELKKKVKYKTLQKRVSDGADKEKQAVIKLVQALNIYENQGSRKQQITDKDNRAWQNAIMENSIQAYQDYIDNYPNGLHIQEAQAKIDQLEKEIQEAEKQQKNLKLIYHVQIMADKHPWSIRDIKHKIFYTNEDITEHNIDGWYKYWVGDFKTYKEAKDKVKQIRRRRKGVFVVATINGQQVDILRALNIEQKTNQPDTNQNNTQTQTEIESF